MSANAFTPTPVRYQPDFEVPEPDEADTARGINEQMQSILDTTLEDYGHPVRSVHAKSHGMLRGELRVLEGLPAVLAQGLFAKPATYPVVMRFSTNPGDLLDDSISVPRGLAVKVVGVAGERLPGSDKDEQDFVMASGAAFTAPNAAKFLGSLTLLAKTTDAPQVLKKVLSAALRGAESVVEAFGGESAALKSLGGFPNTQILGESFYSQVPILYGAYMAKFSVAPIAPELAELTDQKIDTAGKPDALRDSMRDFFRDRAGEWELRVQLCTDLEAMPIEDASVPWPEEKSPYIAVARISAGPQEAWSAARAEVVDDQLSFSPWHGLAAHRPLGSVMRVRRGAYELSAGFRAEHNGCPMRHLRPPVQLPG